MSAPERIRRASIEDVDTLLDLHQEVFDEKTHLALLLGRGFLRAAYRWYVAAPEAFALVAEIDGRVEGACAVNRGSYYTVFGRNLPAVILAILKRPRLLVNGIVWWRIIAVLGRCAHLRAFKDRNARTTAYLAYLTVSPRARGTGVGKRLIEAAILECRKRQIFEIVTAIHRDNLPARFTYKTLGFEEYPELSDGHLVGVRLAT